MILILLPVVTLVASWALTGWVRRQALARAILDIPNARSSHQTPTPRGGGAAIAIPVLLATVVLGVAGAVQGRVVAAVLGGVVVSALGWLDDTGRLRGRDAARRFLIGVLVAAWGAAWVGGLPELSLGAGSLRLGWLGYVVAAFGAVWMTSLFNFMDGIDGLAGGEALSVGVLGAGLLALSGHAGLAALSLVVAAASAGFLAWNWAPARIFMGDVGSGFLGFVYAMIAVASERAGAVPLLAWVILMGVFVFDATVTLLRRMVRGERWYEPHRSHAYQRAVQSGLTHAQVSSGVLVTNAALGALALAGCTWPRLLVPCLAVATLLLTAIYLWVERRAPMPRTD